MSVFSLESGADYTGRPMFLGKPVTVARYDLLEYPILDRFTEQLLAFFWRPEEVDISKDRIDYSERLSDADKHGFTANLAYQTLLDSVQARGPVQILGDLASVPEMEVWLTTWSFSETIHSRSYTHIIRNIYSDPSEVFDSILSTKEIVARAQQATSYYDELEGAKLDYRYGEVGIEVLREKLLAALFSIAILEGIRFYVSFCFSFSFAERHLMEGNAKIIKFIARDEATHYAAVRYIISTLLKDSEYSDIFNSAQFQSKIANMMDDAVAQEKEWAKYLFSKGTVLGLNYQILSQYVEYLADARCKALKIPSKYEGTKNPVPWMNNWLSNNTSQPAPQETEITSYKTADLEGNIAPNSFTGFEL